MKVEDKKVTVYSVSGGHKVGVNAYLREQKLTEKPKSFVGDKDEYGYRRRILKTDLDHSTDPIEVTERSLRRTQMRLDSLREQVSNATWRVQSLQVLLDELKRQEADGDTKRVD